jgi:phenylacetate-CoA ligase
MMYEKIVKHVNLPLYSLVSGKYAYYRHYKRLEKNQWFPPERLEKLQLGLFVELIRCAYKNCEFYKKTIDDLGADCRDFGSMAEFRKLPVISKQTLQKERERIKARNLLEGSFVEDASGGSTGEPTIFYVDNSRYILRNWEQIRHDRWSGWELGEPRASLWGASHEFKAGRNVLARAKNILLHRGFAMDAFALTNETMDDFRRMLIRRKPTLIMAYANAIYSFAQYIDSDNLQGGMGSLKGIVSSAEKLHDFQRELIERVFDCPVFDRLGSREVGLIASECNRHEGLHINVDNLVVEFLDETDSPVEDGKPGRIIVTDLHNRAMPLIRYDTGDIGVWTEGLCSCGRGLPLMKCIEGRTSDFILTKDGRKIHGEYFTHLFYGIRGLKKFQLVQKRLDQMEIKIIKDSEWISSRESEILEKIRSYMRDRELDIELRFVDEIEMPRSGKLRFTISELMQ